MKTCYVDKDSRSIIDLMEVDSLGFHLITRVNVPEAHRRQGIARRLMAEVLAEADRESIVLALWPMPSGDMTRRQLIEWYERLGFVRGTAETGYYMVRGPRRDSSV
jgi:GNAT superfamily N-acetyltransferase